MTASSGLSHIGARLRIGYGRGGAMKRLDVDLRLAGGLVERRVVFFSDKTEKTTNRVRSAINIYV